MILLKVWLLVFAGAGSAAGSAGAGAGVAPQMFFNKASCEAVRRAADGWARPTCVYTSVVMPSK